MSKWYRRQRERGVMDLLSSNPFISCRVDPQRLKFLQACRQYDAGSKELKVALMHRALATIPMLERIGKEGDGIWRMYRRGMCSETLFQSFKKAEAMLQQEMQEVRQAAEAMVPGWGRSIWAEAAQLRRKLLEQRAEQEAKANRQALLERNAKLEKKKKKVEEQATLQKQQKAVRDAEKAAQQLMLEEEAKERRSKPSSQTSKKKKKKR
mmetsp:Transcript_8276/g.31125  ORF Transcript_8276/g.31125 Transcript_8276/m.31125 type:complete len:209 (-) Transcript_8276:100-726(-)